MGIKSDPDQWKTSGDDGRPTIVRNMNMSFEERAKAYGFKPQVEATITNQNQNLISHETFSGSKFL